MAFSDAYIRQDLHKQATFAIADELDEIPMTAAQRSVIDDQIGKMERLFEEANGNPTE